MVDILLFGNKNKIQNLSKLRLSSKKIITMQLKINIFASNFL